MALQRVYDYAAVKAAIDLAEGHKFSSFSSVWGGNDTHFKATNIIHPKTNAVIKTVVKYQPGAEAERISDDEGHTLRNHVKGLQDGAFVGHKSCYDSLDTCINATMEVLNGVKVQAILGGMDADPTMVNTRFKEAVTGNFYGDSGDGVSRKIAVVAMVIMRLGTDTLWIHSSYPDSFV